MEKHTQGPLEAPGKDGDAFVVCTHKSRGKRRTVAHAYTAADAALFAAAPALLKSVGPSDGGTASFPDELDVVARIIDQHDAGSGLGRHLRARATEIRSALAQVQGEG